MRIVTTKLPRLALLLGLMFSPFLAAQAATFYVATNGVDSGTCGPPAMPCRSINTAIDNANPGSVIRVKPGSYSSTTEGTRCGGDCMIEVDKRLRIESLRGRGATFLDGSGLDQAVQITADDVMFGLRGKGFTISGAGDGLLVDANDGCRVTSILSIDNTGDGFDIRGEDHVVKYSHAVGNGDDGFDVDCEGCELDRNEAKDNLENGFVVKGDESVLTYNAATANGADGFRAKSGADDNLFDNNAASGNASSGFDVDGDRNTVKRGSAAGNVEHGIVIKAGTGHEIKFNAVLGNGDNGIKTSVSDAEITFNNIFGNTGSGGNCGLRNSSGAGIVAPLNFFGAATGPGADPADDTCGNAAVTTAPNAASEWGQPYSWLSGL